MQKLTLLTSVASNFCNLTLLKKFHIGRRLQVIQNVEIANLSEEFLEIKIWDEVFRQNKFDEFMCLVTRFKSGRL